MEATMRRVRIDFKDREILTKTLKKNGLKRSWLLLKPQFLTISDVVSYLLHSFDLYHSCPNGIILFIDGFALPPFESTAILKDKDVISVKRKGSGLRGSVKAIVEAKNFVEDEIIEKQPLPSGVKLLANEEFDKETGGYQSENDKDEDEAEKPVQSVQDRNVPSKKRKASNNIESSKKKRRLQVTPESVQKKDIDHCEAIKTPQKKRKLSNRHNHDGTVTCTKNSASVSTNELEKKKEETVDASGGLDGDKKVTRSTLRKRLQRKWRSGKGAQTNGDEGEKQMLVKDQSKNSGSKKDVGTNIEQLAEEDSDADSDLVPVEIRPGYIRFTPSGKASDAQKAQEASGLDVQSVPKSPCEDQTAQKNDWDVNKNKEAKEPYCWNGITNKRKGQKWGKENPSTSWKEQKWGKENHSTFSNEQRDYNGHFSSSRAVRNQPTYWKESRDRSSWTSKKQQANNANAYFEKLVPLTDLPEVGDVIAYRLLELSSTWCPELTSFRVGKISWFDQESNKIMLVPEPEYPLNLEKKSYDDDDDSGQPPQPSAYNEDGSLEIDFPSLVDVRILKRGDPSRSAVTGVPAAANGTSVHSELSNGNKKDTDNPELHTPAAPENGERDVWEEISDAFSKKKAQLSQQDNWNKKQSSTNRSWSYRTLRGSALGPTMARLRAQNGV